MTTELADAQGVAARGGPPLASPPRSIATIEHGTSAASPSGMDFEAHDKEARGCASLSAARARLKESYDRARTVIGEQSPESLTASLPPGPVMGDAPRFAIVSGIEDHTAHHRGALTVYARLLGRVPPMPYMDPM